MNPNLPPPTLSYSLDYEPKDFNTLVSIANFLSPEDCKTFVEYYDHPDRWEPSKVGNENSNVVATHRSSNHQFIFEDHMIGSLLARAVNRINMGKFNYDLTHIEVIQLIRYQEGDFFDWHIDAFSQSCNYRKLSVTVQLSDPADYEGGDLEVSTGAPEKHVAVKDQGSLSIFPSFIQHRVTPVTKGTRYSLVAWICGPPFK